MRAVVLREHGGPDVLKLEEVDDPVPGPGEALVRVKACGLNHLDVWVRKGLPNLKLNYPHILGGDVAGVVEATGPGGDGAWKGSPVLVAPGISCRSCAPCSAGRDDECRSYRLLGEHVPGGYAELVTVPAENLLPLPPNLSFEEAACVPLVFITAWHMAVARARVRPGETVLVMAAGSGVGSAALQIAKLFGATVIAAAGSDAKLEKARRLGADRGVNYEKEDLAARVKALTGGAGADVILDSIGGPMFAPCMRALAWHGRYVTCGSTAGFDARLDLRHLFFRRLSLLGSTMGSRGELHEALKFVADGRLRPVLDTTFPLEKAADAHRKLEGRDVFGKLVLKP